MSTIFFFSFLSKKKVYLYNTQEQKKHEKFLIKKYMGNVDFQRDFFFHPDLNTYWIHENDVLNFTLELPEP